MFESILAGFTSVLEPNLVSLAALIVVPFLAGLLVTWGRWRVVMKAYGIWLALLGVGWHFVTGGNIEHAIFGFIIYFMFFSVFAVPLLSVVVMAIGWANGKMSRLQLAS